MKAALTRSRLQALLQAIQGQRIGVIGDFTLDGYWYADMERSELSRETPLFPRPVVRESYSLGGAANVAWNLAAFALQEVWAFSVLGEDWRGALLTELLEREGIRIASTVKQAGRATPFYGKLILQAAGRPAQEDARLDFINTDPLSRATETALLENLAQTLPTLNALIVADYQEQGVLTPRVTSGLLKLAQEHPRVPMVVDSRSRAAAFQSLILKPNELEAARLFFPNRAPGEVSLADLTQAVRDHQARFGKPIFITRGAQGCLVGFADQCELAAGVPVNGPVDTVGAGDTFIAALAAALAASAAPLEAAHFANLAASVTVQKIGITGTASAGEILLQYDRWAGTGSAAGAA